MAHLNIDGQFYYAGTSESQTVEVNFDDNGHILLTHSGEHVLNCPISSLKLSDKLGDSPRQILFPDGQSLLFSPDDNVENWLKTHLGQSKSSALEQSRSLVLASIIAVPALIYGLFKFVIPAVAVNFASIVPESAISVSSQHTLYTLDKTVLSPSKISQEQQLTYLTKWQSEINALFEEKRHYKIQFRHSKTMGANAFALPDGTVVVTDRLIEIMSDSPDTISAILLHEIGHVEKQHSMRYIAESMATAIVINYLFGDLSGMIDLFVGAGSTAIGNQFSRKLEWEADNFAIDILKKNGKSTDGFVNAMKLFLAEYGQSDLEQLFSTHPLLKDRIENAK